MPQQHIPVAKETTYHSVQKGFGRTAAGTEALIFVDLTGGGHVFPFDEDGSKVELVKLLIENVSAEEKKDLITALTGVTPATSIDLPPGVSR